MSAAQKVVLVTAGSAGLGEAVARLFAQSNARVVVNYANNADRANSLVEELHKLAADQPSSKEEPRFTAIKADMGDRAAVGHLVSETIKQMGRLDVVISNHGWTKLTNFANLDDAMVDEDWDKCLIFNVKSHLWLAHAARSELEKTEGSFVTTASVAGVRPGGSSLAYSVTKAGTIHLTRGLAKICAPKIRFNSVSPGLLLTEWGLKFPQSKIDGVKASSALKRVATVEDVAEQIKLLALSRSITGQNVLIDAGLNI